MGVKDFFKGLFEGTVKINVDNRGSFTEFIKTSDRGQVSMNVSKSSVNKGNHWHHNENEKFLVVNVKGVVRFRSFSNDARAYKRKNTSGV